MRPYVEANHDGALRPATRNAFLQLKTIVPRSSSSSINGALLRCVRATFCPDDDDTNCNPTKLHEDPTTAVTEGYGRPHSLANPQNKPDPCVRRIRWTSHCRWARFLSSSGVLSSSLGRLSNCARDGTKSNRALAVALAESVPCIAALSHSYKLKLVARKSKYIEHIYIQPAWMCGCALRHPTICRRCVE